MNVELFFTKEKFKKVQKQCYHFLLKKKNHSNEINKTGSCIIIYKPRSDFSRDRVLISSTRADHNEKKETSY